MPLNLKMEAVWTEKKNHTHTKAKQNKKKKQNKTEYPDDARSYKTKPNYKRVVTIRKKTFPKYRAFKFEFILSLST